MKRVYVDTNIIIDYLDNRDPLAFVFFKETIGCHYSLIFSDLLIRELASQYYDSNFLVTFLRCINKVEIVNASQNQRQFAHDNCKNLLTHFADALHHKLAIDAGADVLLTKNLKDFSKCQIAKSYNYIVSEKNKREHL